MINGLLKTGEAAAYLHVNRNTINGYRRAGRITPAARTPGGNNLYDKRDLDAFLGHGDVPANHGGIAFYARVSSSSNDYTSQYDRLTRAYGEPTVSYHDKASGLNENRKGLQSLLRDAELHKYSTLCITARDRLTRFGYSYLERLLGEYGVTITVLDDGVDKTPHEELMQDFMSLLASFSGKFYKLRSIKHERMLLERADSELPRA